MKQDMLPQSTRVLHVSIIIRTGRAGHQRKPMSRLSSERQLKLTSAYRIWPARAYPIYFTQSWRSLPSMFVFGTIEDAPNIIRTGCTLWIISRSFLFYHSTQFELMYGLIVIKCILHSLITTCVTLRDWIKCSLYLNIIKFIANTFLIWNM